MPNAQRIPPCKIFLHPMICNRPILMAAFQSRTGLLIIATASGNAQAIPANGGSV